ncbi:nuclear transport factor 2 family protein [Pseudonocardia endophytica]|uniref:Steroid delta-isomerase-like uncharacterized protein n=1 Tax=Pseudonocardia endophytica TaxID=401976 RepID=A0A4R1HWX4_PSEEN|nr:nuclear transport factor 2 family protein [Pseudonocardia endophytica]TCK22042.1 steroid delta-isomerase-like uncharacterized protein [Pseudonocardia endophytica]
MSSSTTVGLTELAEAYLDAYNSGDLERITSFLSDDVHIVHHNRGVDVRGKQTASELFAGAGQVIPDKRFGDRTALDVIGSDSVVVRHTFTATALGDMPGFAAKGEAISLELATFLTFRDGLLVEYHDYG